MSRVPKPNTTQIRPSVTVDTLVVLDAINKGQGLGMTIEKLLLESPTFRKKQEAFKRFKEEE